MILWKWNQKQTGGATSNWKTSAEQRKQENEQSAYGIEETIFKSLGFISKILKKCLQLASKTNKWPKNLILLILKRAKDLNRYFSKEDRQVGNMHMRRCSALLTIRVKPQWDITSDLPGCLFSEEVDETEMLARMKRNQNPWTLLVRIQNGVGTREISI
jgi:hypothetical protein